MLTGPNTIVTWQAPEYFTFKKDPGWYVTLSLLAILISVFFYFVLHKWLPVIVTLLSAVVLFTFGHHDPRIITYSISNKGIKISRLFHPFKGLKSFWFVGNEAGLALYIETVSRLQPSLILQIQGQNPDEIRAALQRHLPEKPSGREDTIDRIARYIKF